MNNKVIFIYIYTFMYYIHKYRKHTAPQTYRLQLSQIVWACFCPATFVLFFLRCFSPLTFLYNPICFYLWVHYQWTNGKIHRSFEYVHFLLSTNIDAEFLSSPIHCQLRPDSWFSGTTLSTISDILSSCISTLESCISGSALLFDTLPLSDDCSLSVNCVNWVKEGKERLLVGNASTNRNNGKK